MKNEIEQMPDLRAYKVNLSKGNAMPCDSDELPNIVLAIKTGAPCKIRSGIFNPSYYVSITEDQERIDEVRHTNSQIYEDNERVRKYGGTKQKFKSLIPIKDIFKDINLAVGNRPTEEQITGETPKALDKPKEEGHYRAMKH